VTEHSRHVHWLTYMSLVRTSFSQSPYLETSNYSNLQSKRDEMTCLLGSRNACHRSTFKLLCANPRSTVLLWKLPVAEVVRNSQLQRCCHVPNTELPEPVLSQMNVANITIYCFLKVNFNIIFPSVPRSVKWPRPFRFSDTLYVHFSCPGVICKYAGSRSGIYNVHLETRTQQ
jgi:hypothetical protein